MTLICWLVSGALLVVIGYLAWSSKLYKDTMGIYKSIYEKERLFSDEIVKRNDAYRESIIKELMTPKSIHVPYDEDH